MITAVEETAGADRGLVADIPTTVVEEEVAAAEDIVDTTTVDRIAGVEAEAVEEEVVTTG